MQKLQDAVIELCNNRGVGRQFNTDPATTVSYSHGYVSVTYHGAKIASISLNKRAVKLWSHGFVTNSTVTRLNHVLGALGSPHTLKISKGHIVWSDDSNFKEGSGKRI